MTEATIKLSELIAPRTAGALPSSRTVSLLDEALASDDIDVVKAQLVHVWAHYQSLEFILNGAAENIETINNARSSDRVENDVTNDLELAAGYFATGAIDVAYENAHSIGFFMQVLGLSPMDALKMIYTTLDYSDPERDGANQDTVIDLGAPE